MTMTAAMTRQLRNAVVNPRMISRAGRGYRGESRQQNHMLSGVCGQDISIVPRGLTHTESHGEDRGISAAAGVMELP